VHRLPLNRIVLLCRSHGFFSVPSPFAGSLPLYSLPFGSLFEWLLRRKKIYNFCLLFLFPFPLIDLPTELSIPFPSLPPNYRIDSNSIQPGGKASLPSLGPPRFTPFSVPKSPPSSRKGSKGGVLLSPFLPIRPGSPFKSLLLRADQAPQSR